LSGPDAKKPLKIGLFLWIFALHHQAVPLSLKSFRRSLKSRDRENVLGERGAPCHGRIKRRDMANQRMTQTQLVRNLAESCEVNNKVARAMLDKLTETAISEVKKNGIFVLPGLGRLVRVERKARMGRNPATGEAIKIAAKKTVKFKVAKPAKDAIVPPKKK
jgi:DNA-binding protein HU-beta